MSLNCLLSDTVDEEQTTSAEIESYTRKNSNLEYVTP